MAIRNFVLGLSVAALATPALAQQVNCSDPANAENEACLALPDDGVTNLVPLIAPALGLLGAGALAAAGGGGAANTATVNTTN